MARRLARHTPEFRAEVLAAYEARGDRTADEIAKQFKIRRGLIYAWKNAASPRKAHGRAAAPRKALTKRGVYGWLTFALNELDKDRPDIAVARSYVTLARHELTLEE